MQEQLQQSHKMEIIGTLAGGIAHDFNNMLAVLLGYSDLVKATLDKESKQQNYIAEVIKAGTRAKDLVSQILNFSRHTTTQFNEISVSLIIKEVVKMLRTTVPSDVDVRYDVPQDLAFIQR